MLHHLQRALDALLDRANTLLALVLRGIGRAEEPEPVYALPSPRYEEHLSIPVREISLDDAAAREAEARGRFLARQERWSDLVAEIRAADLARKATPGGVPIGELLAFGARSDVVLATEHALEEGGAPGDIEGIKGLESARQELGDDPYMAAILALAHIDIGWAWRGSGWSAQLPPVNRERCVAHFDRASDLMAPHCGIELDSPLIAATQCALLSGRHDPDARVADDYEDLIDLDPHNHRHMRALGYHLLPRWFGSYEKLELEALRTTSRTYDIWGAGGYTWVMFDAITIDPEACARVDTAFFIQGMHDILAARPEQEMVNLLAAYCAVAIRQDQGESTAADLARMQIADCADWLIRDYLTEIHPLVWAHALEGFDNNARVTSVNRFAARGRQFAIQAIGDLFRDEIELGIHVTFTCDGPQLDAA
jgi:hypothetical protein